MLFCPQHVCDAHQCIVNGHTEIVDRKTVTPHHHKIPEVVSVPSYFAPHDVVDAVVLQDTSTQMIQYDQATCRACGCVLLLGQRMQNTYMDSYVLIRSVKIEPQLRHTIDATITVHFSSPIWLHKSQND